MGFPKGGSASPVLGITTKKSTLNVNFMLNTKGLILFMPPNQRRMVELRIFFSHLGSRDWLVIYQFHVLFLLNTQQGGISSGALAPMVVCVQKWCHLHPGPQTTAILHIISYTLSVFSSFIQMALDSRPGFRKSSLLTRNINLGIYVNQKINFYHAVLFVLFLFSLLQVVLL